MRDRIEQQELAIEIEGLSKSFGYRLALKGVNLRVKKGEFLAVFGPNGAGKTTLVRILATLSRPSSGTIHIWGLDLQDNASEIRRHIGVVSHQTYLYENLTAYENLRFYGRMYRLPNLASRIEEVISLVGLTSRLHHRVHELSRGMQQRLAIARAIIHDPQVLLLDEPETGLDRDANQKFRETLASLHNNARSMVITTHNLEGGLSIADRVVVINEGKVIYDRAKSALDAGHFQDTYSQLIGVKA